MSVSRRTALVPGRDPSFGWGFESTGEGYYYDIYCPDARDVSGGLWDQSSGGPSRGTRLHHVLDPDRGHRPDGVVATRLLDPAGAQFGLVALPTEPTADVET